MSGLNPQSRDIILGRIRRALGTGDDEVQRRVAVQRRLSAPAPGPIPARTKGTRGELVQQLKTRLEGLAASAEIVPLPEIPARIADFLKRNNLPAAFRLGADPLLGGLDWSTAPSLSVAHGPARPEDEVSVTHAVAAAAETGTLVLVSGADNPTTLSFLPETEIIVVRSADVEGSYEATWSKIRALYGDRNMPRTVNWVSGPSRTGDIDQTIVLGAHGPRRLHVIIAED
ncbi:MAG: LUD domain-containing protein [Hyphomicrobiaceae bacterium]